MESKPFPTVRPPLYKVSTPMVSLRLDRKKPIVQHVSGLSPHNAVTGSTLHEEKTAAQAFVRRLESQIREERSTFTSFAALCGEAMMKAKQMSAADESRGELPHHLTVGVAAMLLIRLSQALERYGPLLRELLGEVLPAVYSNATAAQIRSQMDNAVAADLPTSCDFLLRHHLHCDESFERQLHNSILSKQALQLSTSLSRSASLFAGVTSRECGQTKRHAFLAWRSYVTGRKSVAEHWLAARQRAIDKAKKKVALAEWRRFTAEARERRIAFASARNSEMLMARINELSRQIAVREEEIERQRLGREKAVQRALSAEVLLDHERLDAARLRSRLADAESIGQSLLGMSGIIMGRMETAMPMLAIGPPRSVIQAAATSVVSDSSKVDQTPSAMASPLSNPPTKRASTLPHIATGDVKSALLQWTNDRISEVGMALRVSNLEEDFADGRAYVAILTVITGVPPPGGLDSSSERATFVLQTTRTLEVDGGVTQTELMSASGAIHCALVCRLLLKYAMTEVTQRTASASANSTMKSRESSPRRGDVRAIRPVPGSESPANPAPLSTRDPPLSAEAMVGIMRRFEHLHIELANHKQWQRIALSAINYASRASNLTSNDDQLGLKAKALVNVTPPKLMAVLPQGMIKFAGSNEASNAQEGASEVEDAMAFLCNELRAVLADVQPPLTSAFQHYCTLTQVDVNKPSVVDNSGWSAFLADVKLVPKHVTRINAENVFKAHSNLIEESDWPIVLIRLFLAREGQLTSNVDEIGDEFKAFVHQLIVPQIPSTLIPTFSAVFNAAEVQDELKTYRENLRKIFSEVGTREPVNGASITRFRLASFVALNRDLKVFTDDADVKLTFGCVRLAVAAADSTVSSAGAAPGLGFLGFTAVVVALALARESKPFQPAHIAVRAFCCGLLFLAFKERLKLKW